MEWPVFGPRLTPDATTSGGSPKAPSTAAIAISPGGAAIVHASIGVESHSNSTRRTSN